MKEIIKEYSNGEVTVIWKPALCIHAAFCWKGLSEVFDPEKRPWININGANTEKIIAQVNECPSGALSYYMDKDVKNEVERDISDEANKVKVLKDGPLLVYGNLEIEKIDGNKDTKNGCTSFCRCGASKNKPYCDGSHKDINFKD